MNREETFRRMYWLERRRGHVTVSDGKLAAGYLDYAAARDGLTRVIEPAPGPAHRISVASGGLPAGSVGKRAAAELTSRMGGKLDPISQLICLGEEAGEALGAFRRWDGRARRNGTREEFEQELADVVIAAYTLAQSLEIDLDRAVENKHRINMTRPLKGQQK